MSTDTWPRPGLPAEIHETIAPFAPRSSVYARRPATAPVLRPMDHPSQGRQQPGLSPAEAAVNTRQPVPDRGKFDRAAFEAAYRRHLESQERQRKLRAELTEECGYGREAVDAMAVALGFPPGGGPEPGPPSATAEERIECLRSVLDRVDDYARREATLAVREAGQ